jgi:tripartite-type tricarboxylate transporter receptor subunit TctC
MSTELFSYMAKIKMTQIAYKGGGPTTIGLISGEADVIITALTSAIPQMKERRVHDELREWAKLIKDMNIKI